MEFSLILGVTSEKNTKKPSDFIHSMMELVEKAHGGFFPRRLKKASKHTLDLSVNK